MSEGNEVNKFLSSLDDLREVIPPEFASFVDFFDDLRETIQSTFGFELDPNYKTVLSRLNSSFQIIKEKFDVPETVKLHIMLTHLEQFIDITGKSLACIQNKDLRMPTVIFEKFGSGSWLRTLHQQTACQDI